MKEHSSSLKPKSLKNLFFHPPLPNKTRPRLKGWIFCVLGLGLFIGPMWVFSLMMADPERDVGKSKSKTADIAPGVNAMGTAHQGHQDAQNFVPPGDYGASGGGGNRSGQSGNGGNRTYSASALVGDDTGKMNAGSFPQGSVVPVRLSQTVVTAKNPSPVSAVLTQEFVSERGGTSIPEGSKVIGTATLDEDAERLMVQFSTLLFPDGTKYPIQAVGLLSDGSYGLTGDFDSNTMKRDTGRVLGSLVSGFAEGMKTRTTTPYGMQTETGSLRNGLLNGVSDVASDHAKESVNSLSTSKAKITVPMGTDFILYFERDFSP